MLGVEHITCVSGGTHPRAVGWIGIHLYIYTSIHLCSTSELLLGMFPIGTPCHAILRSKIKKARTISFWGLYVLSATSKSGLYIFRGIHLKRIFLIPFLHQKTTDLVIRRIIQRAYLSRHSLYFSIKLYYRSNI